MKARMAGYVFCFLFIYLFIITGLVQRRVSIYLHDLLTFKMFKNVSIAYRLRFLEMRSLGRLSIRCKENQEEWQPVNTVPIF